MSLELILLGALREPASGYQIRKDFDALFGSFWSSELSQIYRTLKSLERKGYLESRLEQSETGPARKVYRRTPQGHSRLLSQLRGDAIVGDERVPYLAQLYYLGELEDLGRSLELLTAVRDHHAAQLELLGDVARPSRKRLGAKRVEADDDRDLHLELVRAHGRARSRAIVDWAEEAIATIQARRRGRSRSRGGRRG